MFTNEDDPGKKMEYLPYGVDNTGNIKDYTSLLTIAGVPDHGVSHDCQKA